MNHVIINHGKPLKMSDRRKKGTFCVIFIAVLAAAYCSPWILSDLLRDWSVMGSAQLEATELKPTNSSDDADGFQSSILHSNNATALVLLQYSRRSNASMGGNITINAHEITSHVLYTDLYGGLGNQLWMFLSSQGIARVNRARAAYAGGGTDESGIQMLEGVFTLKEHYDFDVVQKATFPSFRKWDESDAKRYRPIILNRSMHLRMYLQNPKYVAETPDIFADEVKQKLLFQPAVLHEAQALLDGMAGSCNDAGAVDDQLSGASSTRIVKSWVGIHVRRFPNRHKSEPLPSDRIWNAQINRVFQQCEENQLLIAEHPTSPTIPCKKSTSNSSIRFSPCCALVFSNDPDWAREHISLNGCIQFVENDLLEDPMLKGSKERNNAWATHYGRDLAAMTLCDYLVIAVGTFGYFGAILHGGNNGTMRNREIYAYNQSQAGKNGLMPSTWKRWPGA